MRMTPRAATVKLNERVALFGMRSSGKTILLESAVQSDLSRNSPVWLQNEYRRSLQVYGIRYRVMQLASALLQTPRGRQIVGEDGSSGGVAARTLLQVAIVMRVQQIANLLRADDNLHNQTLERFKTSAHLLHTMGVFQELMNACPSPLPINARELMEDPLLAFELAVPSARLVALAGHPSFGCFEALLDGISVIDAPGVDPAFLEGRSVFFFSSTTRRRKRKQGTNYAPKRFFKRVKAPFTRTLLKNKCLVWSW